MGKIADALGNFEQERKSKRFPGLTQADLDILLAYDQRTGHLLHYDKGSGQMGNHSLEVLRNRGILQRLLDYKLIYPDGKLTPRGLEICELQQKNVPDQTPPVSTDAQPVGKPADQSSAADAPTRAEENAQTLPRPALESHRLEKTGRSETAPPQKTARKKNVPSKSRPRQKLPFYPPQEAADKPATVPEPRFSRTGAQFDEKAIDVNLISLRDPQSYEAEQFKILRSNLLFPVSGAAPRSILVTGALPGDGKSFVSANLAVSIALNINKHVLLIDCDLRKPDIHRMFGFGEVPGLSEYLMEHHDLGSLLLKSKVDKLTLLPGGSVPPNPSELMSTERMSALIEEVKVRYPDRLIVLDSPPPALAAETAFLARYVDGIVLVVKQGSTPRQEVEDMINTLGSDKIIGCVVNQLDVRISRYYGRKKYNKYGKRYYK